MLLPIRSKVPDLVDRIPGSSISVNGIRDRNLLIDDVGTPFDQRGNRRPTAAIVRAQESGVSLAAGHHGYPSCSHRQGESDHEMVAGPNALPGLQRRGNWMFSPFNLAHGSFPSMHRRMCH